MAGEHVKIRIAVNADSISTWFSKVVARAGAELEVLFDIVPDDQEYTAEYLRKGEALAAVTADAVPVHGFRIVNIGTLDYVPAATPEFIKIHFPDGINPKALDESPSILFDRKDSISYQWIKTTFNSSAKLTPHYVPSFSGYLQACLDGVGWGLVPEIAARPYLKSGTLVELQPGTNVKVPLHWQYSVNAGQTMRALSMIVMDVARGELMSEQPSQIDVTALRPAPKGAQRLFVEFRAIPPPCASNRCARSRGSCGRAPLPHNLRSRRGYGLGASRIS